MQTLYTLFYFDSQSSFLRIGLLCQYAETTCEVIQQHLKSARRRVPRDHTGSLISANLGLDEDYSNQLFICYQASVKIMKTLQILLKSALQAIVANGGEYFIKNYNISILYKNII